MKRLSRFCALFVMLCLVSACTAVPVGPSGIPSALAPSGPAAARIASLWWVMLALSAIVFALILVLLFMALLRNRRATRDTSPDSQDGDTGRSWLIRGGIILPVLVLTVVFGYTVYTLAAVENPQGQAGLRINVTARRWWWQVQYPGQDVTTANEIHIPVGIPVQIQLESADVIHSFWVPELHGKMDVIPGQINYITIQADKPGVYRGECAEFCGLQHALMGVLVVAQSADEYNHWLAAQQQPAQAPTDPAAVQGQQVFISAGCDFCHAVGGIDEKKLVASSPDLGPDLTHLNSRLTIVGASLDNNPNNLAGWVIDAQHIKPGSDMPTMHLSSQDLQYLVAYLLSLK